MGDEHPTVGEYLIDALAERGVEHVFGVPGDFILPLFQIGAGRGMTMVNSTREETAAYAADGYARERGLGVAAVTFGVGILAPMAAIGGANVERVPLVLVGGGPGMQERDGRQIHHMPSDDMAAPRRMMSEIVAEAVLLDDPALAYERIDGALDTALRRLRPVFIEVPRDLFGERPAQVWRHRAGTSRHGAGEAARRAATEDLRARIAAAERPVIWSGVGVLRRRLGDGVIALAERIGAPVVESVMGKGCVPETHPLVLGVYAGATTEPHLRRLVEDADLVVEVEVHPNDINLGAFTVDIPRERIVRIDADEVVIGHRTYHGVGIATALGDLLDADLPDRPAPEHLPHAWDVVSTDGGLTTDAIAAVLDGFLEVEDLLVSDVGAAAHLIGDVRLSSPYQLHIARSYVGMGFSIPAAAGAGLANGGARPIVVIGDGAFQMTGFDLSTAVRYGVHPIVLVLENHGYTTERAITDGPFNDIARWDYAKVADVVGAVADHAWIVEVALDAHDYPRSLRELAAGLERLMHARGDGGEE